MSKVVVFGNGIMAEMMHFYLTHDSEWDVVGFAVDESRMTSDSFLGAPLVAFEDIERRYPPEDHRLSIPISYRGLNRIRADRFFQAKAKGYEFVSYISSRASVWPDLTIGENCIITEGCVVQPFARIGQNVFMGCGSVAGHHAVIEDHCFLGPGAITLGHVRVGPYSLLGANSTVRDAITVGAECVIGAGVTLSRDALPNQVYLGTPAQLVPRSSDQLREWLTWGF